MKNFYDFIVTNIKMGHWVAVKKKNGDWRVFMYVRPDGRLEGTVQRNTFEESLKDGLYNTNYTKEDIEAQFTTKYKIVTPASLLLEPGTKVEILKNVSEIVGKDGFILDAVSIIGQKGLEIEKSYPGTYYVYNKNKTASYEFPNWAVAPIYELENTIELSDDELIAELEKRGRLKDKKVID